MTPKEKPAPLFDPKMFLAKGPRKNNFSATGVAQALLPAPHGPRSQCEVILARSLRSVRAGK
jgi:hypothetical protein